MGDATLNGLYYGIVEIGHALVFAALDMALGSKAREEVLGELRVIHTELEQAIGTFQRRIEMSDAVAFDELRKAKEEKKEE